MKTQTQNPMLAEVELLSLTNSPATRWMDIPKFNLLTGGFQVIMHETAAAFIEFMPGMLRDLRTAVDGQDIAATAKILHKLKSSLSLLCVDAMSAEVADLERNASNVANTDFIGRINRLIICIHHLVLEVTQFSRL
jgi:HPt (histidine-containing phosphotransfer) domain-containing protein